MIASRSKSQIRWLDRCVVCFSHTAFSFYIMKSWFLTGLESATFGIISREQFSVSWDSWHFRFSSNYKNDVVCRPPLKTNIFFTMILFHLFRTSLSLWWISSYQTPSKLMRSSCEISTPSCVELVRLGSSFSCRKSWMCVIQTTASLRTAEDVLDLVICGPDSNLVTIVFFFKLFLINFVQ